jgi:hypothetical protein
LLFKEGRPLADAKEMPSVRAPFQRFAKILVFAASLSCAERLAGADGDGLRVWWDESNLSHHRYVLRKGLTGWTWEHENDYEDPTPKDRTDPRRPNVAWHPTVKGDVRIDFHERTVSFRERWGAPWKSSGLKPLPPGMSYTEAHRDQAGNLYVEVSGRQAGMIFVGRGGQPIIPASQFKVPGLDLRQAAKFVPNPSGPGLIALGDDGSVHLITPPVSAGAPLLSERLHPPGSVRDIALVSRSHLVGVSADGTKVGVVALKSEAGKVFEREIPNPHEDDYWKRGNFELSHSPYAFKTDGDIASRPNSGIGVVPGERQKAAAARKVYGNWMIHAMLNKNEPTFPDEKERASRHRIMMESSSPDLLGMLEYAVERAAEKRVELYLSEGAGNAARDRHTMEVVDRIVESGILPGVSAESDSKAKSEAREVVSQMVHLLADELVHAGIHSGEYQRMYEHALADPNASHSSLATFLRRVDPSKVNPYLGRKSLFLERLGAVASAVRERRGKKADLRDLPDKIFGQVFEAVDAWAKKRPQENAEMSRIRQAFEARQRGGLQSSMSLNSPRRSIQGCGLGAVYSGLRVL